MIDRFINGLRIPNVSHFAAWSFVLVVFSGALRAFMTGHLPLIGPVIAALVSATFLLAVNNVSDSVLSLTRLGFHIGVFGYFVFIPLILPETIEANVPEATHRMIALILILAILGFEAGYSVMRVLTRRSVSHASRPDDPTPKQRQLTGFLIVLGLACWLFATIDYSTAADVSIWDLLMTMRGRVEGSIENPITQFGHWAYLLSGGLYLATAAAFALLNQRKRTSPPVSLLCWSVLLLSGVVGFLSGSRALFLYSFAPITLSCWVLLSRRAVGRPLRLLVIPAFLILIAMVWLAMTSIRGGDVREYEGRLEDLQPVQSTRQAFDMYSVNAEIVEAFPNSIDYQYGKSLIPLIGGWIPRSVWPSKPYPFSIYANQLRGETLDDRSASLAVGLMGEGYGNFGLIGVIVWCLLMGVACRIADDFLLRKFQRADPLRLFLGAYMFIWAAMIVRGGVPEMFYMGLQVNLFPIALSLAFRSLNRSQKAGRLNGLIFRRQLSVTAR